MTVEKSGAENDANNKKTVTVTDPDGTICSPTYKKRAKGLVKHGRARYSDESETEIILTRPPYQINGAYTDGMRDTEDKMNNINNIEEINKNDSTAGEKPAQSSHEADAGEVNAINEFMLKTDGAEKVDPEITMAEIIGYMNEIRADNAHIQSAISELRQMETSFAGDIAGAQKAEAIGNIVVAREETNRKILDFYIKLYDDIRQSNAYQHGKISIIENILNRMQIDEIRQNFDEINNFIDNLRHLND
ncbi:MAG: hypothetical protein WCQ72_03815 [Eubacteriales bacterium]